MKRFFYLCIIAFLAVFTSVAQPAGDVQKQVKEDFVPNIMNQPGQQYPMVNSEGYARFRIVAPKAESVVVSLGLGAGAVLFSKKTRKVYGQELPRDLWIPDSTIITLQ